ncbi:MAG: hypothetical protein ACHQ52_14300, partial [Candidatus Eisenbacteria bacterium]
MRSNRLVAAVAVLVIAASCSCGRTVPRHPLDLWFYESVNLSRDDAVAQIEPLWRRAAAAGYTHVVLGDPKLSRPADQDERYHTNAELLARLAAILHLEIVPSVFPLGRGQGAMLVIDPNLAEALPVREARFVVKSGIAAIEPDPPVTLGPKPDRVESGMRLGEGLATVNDPGGIARMTWNVKVSPFRSYHVSVKVRTMDFSGEPVLRVSGNRKRLDWTTLRTKSTQDWTAQDVVFDSFDNDEVRIVIGVLHRGHGIAQWRDWRIEECGPVNLVRRAGAPLAVRDGRSGRALEEGRDFAPLADSLLGNVPWRGQFDVWHRPPQLRTHGLPDGTTLRVSWYQAAVVSRGQVALCLSDTAVKRRLVEEAANTRALFGSHAAVIVTDEIRAIGWDAACAATGRSAGRILADHMRSDVAMLRGMDLDVYVWNDMFDPSQNAVADYYLANGDLAGSWEGLDSSVTVINWNGKHRAESLRFFARQGHRQVIAAYYDGRPAYVRQDLDAAAGVPGLTGVMYTTW